MFASQPPHIRQVIWLAIAAVLLTLTAIVSVIVTRMPATPVYKPEVYFPGLAADAGKVRRIHIQDKTNATDLSYAPETGWVVVDKDRYKARAGKIQALIHSFRELERYEKRTDDAKWQKRLMLTDPRKEGEASFVELEDGSGKPLAQLLIGVNADVDAASGHQQFYVRAPGDNQVWLARGSGLTPVSADSSDWVDTTIIDVPKKRIARADVALKGEAPYAVVHRMPEDANFTIETMPAGMKLKTETSANGVGTVLSGLALRDVARADRIAFSPDTTVVTYTTFNGLTIRVETAKLGNDLWVRLIPSTSEKADVQAKEEAVDLARRLSPWVFQIESWKATELQTKLSSLIEPVGASSGSHSGNASPKPAGSAEDNSMLVPASPSHGTEQKPSMHTDNEKGTKAPDEPAN